MTRDEMVIRIMNDNRPEPTPAFSASVRSALCVLPDKKKRNSWRLPKAALAFAAVVLACLLVTHLNAMGWLFGPASGPDDAAAGQTGATQGQSFFQGAPSVCTDNGVTETISYACINEGVLYFTADDHPMPQQSLFYQQDMTIMVNGVAYRAYGGGSDSESDYISMGGELPLAPATGYSVHVVIDSTVDSYPADLAENLGPDLSFVPGTRVATFHHEFDLPVTYVQREIKATGWGSFSYGCEAQLEHIYQTKGLTTIVLTVRDDKAGDLGKQLDALKKNDQKNPVSPYDSSAMDGANYFLFCMSGYITDPILSDTTTTLGGGESLLKRNADGTMQLMIFLDSAVDLSNGLTICTFDYSSPGNTVPHYLSYFIKAAENP